MVRLEGLEPPRRRRQNLNLVRLPISPQPHDIDRQPVRLSWWTGLSAREALQLLAPAARVNGSVVMAGV